MDQTVAGPSHQLVAGVDAIPIEVRQQLTRCARSVVVGQSGDVGEESAQAVGRDVALERVPTDGTVELGELVAVFLQ